MRTKYLVLLILTAVGVTFNCSSCNKDDEVVDPTTWKSIQTEIFSVEVPSNWYYVDLHGIDTYNGLFTNAHDSMHFDYGISPDTFTIDPAIYNYHYEVIDGRTAKILEGKDSTHRYGIAIDSAKVTEVSQNPTLYAVRSFQMMQKSNYRIDQATALRILRSVKFNP
jgi:hypothetical protein